MARSLSLVRRRANLVDIALQARANVSAYQFSWATNFDQSATLFETVPAAGKRSTTVNESGFVDGNFRNQTRFLFNPADYSIPDTKPFWLTIKQVSTAGVVGSAEALHLILPYSSIPHRPLILKGGVAQAADVDHSLELQLPMQCWNLQIQVDGTSDLQVAAEPGGYEYRVPSLQNQFTNLEAVYPTFSQLFLRGDSGATTVSIMASLRNNSFP